MKKRHLFVLIAFGILSAAAFFRARATRLQSTFHTATTVDGVRVYGNFCTTISAHKMYLATAGGARMTLFTIQMMIKRVYRCN